ncbi:DUF397 domain-containing protein [Actinomadura logoneensis]|uniref:DUF397 domain-containing protein n=1 Tax=Actinomadura logoneensis TaxID=2293572 RepID=A0A372JJ96_9ACTN|nr:DUF397 domain-containing protein [Actinomadura logoneensis]RFU40020.1 DUF397 domain-containing protein [Actinomadura logoneensis]
MSEFPDFVLRWRKSSHSGVDKTDCVEVAALRGARAVAARDSKDPGGPVLAFGVGTWSAFLGCVKDGLFDL